MKRHKVGKRRHRATVEKHNGNRDEHGQPTYRTAGDWDTVVASWPCEILTTGGAEVNTGRTAAQYTTHVFHGSHSGGSSIDPDMRLNVDGVYYSVIAAYDPDGDRREWWVDARREELQ